MAPTEAGMRNGIGIENRGIDRWVEEIGERLRKLDVPVCCSAAAHPAISILSLPDALPLSDNSKSHQPDTQSLVVSYPVPI